MCPGPAAPYYCGSFKWLLPIKINLLNVKAAKVFNYYHAFAQKNASSFKKTDSISRLRVK